MSGYLRSDRRINSALNLTILPSGRTVKVIGGTRLLVAITDAGESVTDECGSRSRCGSCHVVVRFGWRSLSKIRTQERERLTQLNGAELLSRLACQAMLGVHDVTVELMPH
ncbi:MAG: 2Fe-2S iron-sulfur cluster binding domain-containing protein [Methyloglobulus sp.]|nr:2Fe-2S iron-sulfur cluster binding domain-containing protein [Methyloglobulus sp.]